MSTSAQDLTAAERDMAPFCFRSDRAQAFVDCSDIFGEDAELRAFAEEYRWISAAMYATNEKSTDEFTVLCERQTWALGKAVEHGAETAIGAHTLASLALEKLTHSLIETDRYDTQNRIAIQLLAAAVECLANMAAEEDSANLKKVQKADPPAA